MLNYTLFSLCQGKEDVKSLIMSGIPGDLAITKMRKLERETGLKLTTIISSGDFHHMAMKSWLTEYPDITIVMYAPVCSVCFFHK